MSAKATSSNRATGADAPVVAADGIPETGLERWKAIRKQWQTRTVTSEKGKIGEVKTKDVNVEMVIERIFAPKATGQLDAPVPLGQMIDILIDFWEADGLYD